MAKTDNPWRSGAGKKPRAPNIQLAAARVLRQVIDEGRSLDRTLEAESALLPPERVSRLRELGYGGCRYFALLDGLASGLLDKPVRAKDRIIHFLLVVGLYQLEFLRTPDHAAVDETVSALNKGRQSWARGLVNGVLREYIRRRNKGGIGPLKENLSPAQRASFSDYLFDAVHDSWPDQAEQILSASIARPPLTLRVNQQKVSRDDYVALLAENELSAAPTADSGVGVTLAQPVPVASLPKFAEGWASVQDEAAQLCSGLMGLAPDLAILDACAAPGGKTCAMLEAEPTLRMVALDLPDRVDSIHENLARIGIEAEVQDTGLFQHEAWSDGRQWQRILLDVPCSGSGIIRRHPDILHRREDGDIERFADQQLELLAAAWELLESGGQLLYVTCSILVPENDGVIGRFLDHQPTATAATLTGIEGIETHHGIQRLPGLHAGDGFYYCRLQKL